MQTPNEILQKAKEALSLAIQQKKQNEDFVHSIGPAIVDALAPTILELRDGIQATHETLIRAIENIKIAAPVIDMPKTMVDVKIPEIKVPAPEVTVNVPEIKLPTINVPKPQVTVNIPPFPKIPDFPKIEFPESIHVDGAVSLLGINYKSPLAVRLVDLQGRPYESHGGASVGGGGGPGNFFTIKDIVNSTGGSIIDNDGNVKVAGSFSVTSSTASTQLIDSSGTPYSAANPLPTTASVTLSAAIGQGDSSAALRVVQAGDSSSSVAASQVGTWNINAVTSITNSVAATLVDSSGVAYSGSNPLPTSSSATLSAATGQGDAASALRVVIAGNSDASVSAVQSGTWNVGTVTTVTGITNTVAAVEVDSSGIAYSGSNPLPIGLRFTDGTAVNQSGGNMLVNVSNFAIGTYGNSDATAANLTSALSFSENLGFNGTSWDRLHTNAGDSAGALRVVSAVDAVSSVSAAQAGTWNIGTVTTVTGVTNSVAATLVDSSGVAYSGSNPLPTTASATLSVPVGQGDSATAMRVVIAGNSDASVTATQTGTWNISTVTAVTGITNSVAATLVDSSGVAYSGSNPLPTTSTATLSAATGQGDAASALRVVVAGNSDASVSAVQSGTWNIGTVTTVTGITNSVAATLVDSSGVAYSGSNPLPTTASVTLSAATGQGDGSAALRTIQAGDTSSSVAATQVGTWNITTLSSITASVAASLVDSSGVQYSGSNPLPTTATLSTPQGQGDAATAMRVVIAGNSDASVSATQVGTWNIGTVTTVTGVTNSISAAISDSSGVQYSGSNPVPVTLISGTISSTKAQIGNSDGDFSVANPLPITGPVVVTSVTNSIAASLVDSSGVQYSGSNPLPTTASLSVAQGQGDAATAMRVVVAGNSDMSVSATQVGTWNITTLTGVTNSVAVVALDRDGNPLTTGPIAQGDSATALRVVIAGNSDASVTATQSGTWNIGTVTTVTGVTNTVAASLVDSSGVQYSGSNPLPTSASLSVPQGQGDAATAMRVVIAGNSDASVTATQTGTWNIGTVTTVTGITNSVSSSLIDSSGIQYSGSNPVPVTVVSGAASSTVAVGDSAARTADNGGNPLKVGGIARTTNPTAYADGDRANFSTDKLGRQLIRTVQVRDLMLTAYATLSNGTETTVLTAAAGTYADLIYLMAANTSSNAQQVDIRNTSGGNIITTLYVPANSTIGFSLPVPIPQDATGNSWTADMADVTNSNILITALFSKEI